MVIQEIEGTDANAINQCLLGHGDEFGEVGANSLTLCGEEKSV